MVDWHPLKPFGTLWKVQVGSLFSTCGSRYLVSMGLWKPFKPRLGAGLSAGHEKKSPIKWVRKHQWHQIFWLKDWSIFKCCFETSSFLSPVSWYIFLFLSDFSMKSGGLPKVSPMIIATEVFESEDDVANAIAMLDGTELNGNTLLVLNFIGP